MFALTFSPLSPPLLPTALPPPGGSLAAGEGRAAEAAAALADADADLEERLKNLRRD